MLRPSYTELMELLNSDPEIDNKISSRYTIVIAVAKRARQLIEGAQTLADNAPTDKAVTMAVSEISTGKIKVRTMNERNDEESIFSGSESVAE